MDNCPYCGTKLKETTWDRKLCPNCGIIEGEVESNEEIDRSYIG